MFIEKHYGTALRYADNFDQGVNMLGRSASAVTPTIDQLDGTQTSREAKQLTADYNILRSKAMGIRHEGQSTANHLMGDIRIQVP